MDSIAIGCLLAIHEGSLRQRFGWICDAPAVAIATPLAGLIIGMACYGGAASALWGLVAALFAATIFICVKRTDWILNNPAIVATGILSHSLYLWQEPFTLNRSLGVTARLLLSVACASLSYFIVERPLIAIGKEITKHPSSPGRLIALFRERYFSD